MPPSGPTISAVVVTRDRPRLLADALSTMARQILAPLEVRIGDDGESPAHEAVEAAGMLEVTVIPARAGQAGAARNLAARGARGDVLAFLDDDDRWLPDHLSGLAGAFADPSVDLAFRDCAIIREHVDAAGQRIALDQQVIARDWDEAVMRHDDYLPPSGWGVRRALFERLGGFDEQFRYSEDWDFLLRAAAVTAPRRAPGVTVEVRIRDSGNTSAERGAERRACLDLLARRHGLQPLVIKTFWEVALTVNARVGE